MSHPSGTVDPTLRSLLVCPVCRGVLEEHAQGLACRACRLVYPVVQGCPWMLPERARKWRDGPRER